MEPVKSMACGNKDGGSGCGEGLGDRADGIGCVGGTGSIGVGIDGRVGSALNWLLEEGSPCVRLRALTEVVGLPPDDREVQNARDAVDRDPQVVALLKKMHTDGYWLHNGKGAGVDYVNGATTHFVISYLSELGLDRSYPGMAKAVERYLSLTDADATGTQQWQIPPDYRNHQPCLYTYNLRSFIRAGYRDDPRVQKRIQLLLDDARWDGGYLCHRPSRRATAKSCMRGSLKALSAFAELPELHDTAACRCVVEYFLRRHLFFRSGAIAQSATSSSPSSPVPVRPEFTAPRFPFTIYGSLLEVMYAISKLGYGNHPATQEGWGYLEQWSDADGRCRLARSPKGPFDAGPYEQPSKWATLYALLARKHRVAGQRA